MGVVEQAKRDDANKLAAQKIERLGNLMEKSGDRIAEAIENMAENPTEKLLNEVEVVEAEEVTATKKRGVTAKTIGAFSTQLEKMIEDNLLDTEEGKQMKELLTKAKNRWIEKILK